MGWAHTANREDGTQRPSHPVRWGLLQQSRGTAWTSFTGKCTKNSAAKERRDSLPPPAVNPACEGGGCVPLRTTKISSGAPVAMEGAWALGSMWSGVGPSPSETHLPPHTESVPAGSRGL